MRDAARSGSRRVTFSLALAAASAAVLASSATAAPGDLGVTMVKDINPDPGEGTVQSVVRFGDVVLFVSDDGASGEELWRSDGTAAGTTMVKDINPGNAEDPPEPDSSDPENLTVVGGTVYFAASDGVTGQELWRTDGTAAGTMLVEDINPGEDEEPGDPDSSQIDQMAGVNGTLFFQATDDTNGPELWKSDGTEPGTQILNGPDGINPTAGAGSSPYGMTAVGTTLFFGANDGSTGTELWKSESPHTSAVPAANINPATASSNPVFFTDYNGTLLFRATDGATGIELWKSNGGPLGAGTELVEDINQNPTPSADSNPSELTVVGSTLYLQANDGSTGAELWKSDGTAPGTDRVADIITGTTGSTPQLLSDVGGTLFFRAADSTAGLEPWKSNGGALGGGTDRIADVRPGFTGSEPGTFGGFADVAGTAFFDANDGVNGQELWMSNGGPLGGGTRLVANINPGAASSNPGQLTNVNGTLFFRATDASNGSELWRTFIEGAPPSTPTTSTPIESQSACAELRRKLKKAKTRAKKKKIRGKLRKLGC
jgi:ELWxxDGT repeat protein